MMGSMDEKSTMGVERSLAKGKAPCALTGVFLPRVPAAGIPRQSRRRGMYVDIHFGDQSFL